MRAIGILLLLTTSMTLAAEPSGTVTNSLGMRFVSVPGTDVLFSIWETRVQDYAAYAAERNDGDGSWKNPTKNSVPVTPDPSCPVVSVSWDDAQAFCVWLTRKEQAAGQLSADQIYRLPTDAEWSLAVGLKGEPEGSPYDKRLKNRELYPWGLQWPPPPKAGNFADGTLKSRFTDWLVIEGYDDGHIVTAPVGSFAANAFGLFDLGGNVLEWCEDLYQSGSRNRVLRSSSWDSYDSLALVSSARKHLPPDRRYRHIGFRCVLTRATSAP